MNVQNTCCSTQSLAVSQSVSSSLDSTAVGSQTGSLEGLEGLTGGLSDLSARISSFMQGMGLGGQSGFDGGLGSTTGVTASGAAPSTTASFADPASLWSGGSSFGSAPSMSDLGRSAVGQLFGGEGAFADSSSGGSKLPLPPSDPFVGAF